MEVKGHQEDKDACKSTSIDGKNVLLLITNIIDFKCFEKSRTRVAYRQ
jgi:hypothetical protein